MQTSKLILFVDFIIAILLTAVVIIGTFIEKDMTQVAIVAACWDAQMTAAVGFYYWKAKNENRSKHAMNLVEKLAQEHGIENVVNLVEVILND